MNINPIRKIVQKVGLDIRRYRPEVDKLTWLKDSNINTVIDIGANVGQFAEEIRSILPEAYIYSFEPLHECFEQLKKNMEGDGKFTAFNLALGDKDEKVTMHKSAYSLSSSLLPMAEQHKQLFPHTAEYTDEIITTKTLDAMALKMNLKNEVLIKVDTQGYEGKVIRGGQNFMRKAKVAIMETSYVELYKGQPLFDTIYETMKSLGFTYCGALHQKLNSKTGKIIFEDSIFVK